MRRSYETRHRTNLLRDVLRSVALLAYGSVAADQTARLAAMTSARSLEETDGGIYLDTHVVVVSYCKLELIFFVVFKV